jgi:hypothetical protein
MKRFWLVLLSLGLVMAFSASAFAVDVKFSGSFYAAGMYFDKTAVQDTNAVANTIKAGDSSFYFQRLRLKTDFVVSPGLTLVTRANIMERSWGGTRTTPSATLAGDTSSLGLPGGAESAGTVAENQNIAFDWAYIHWVSPFGIWDVGYQLDGPWGTKFGDTDYANGRVFWILPVGNWMFAAGVVKLGEGTVVGGTGVSNVTASNLTDVDGDKYAVGFLYQWKGGQAGLLAGYWRYSTTKATANTVAGLANSAVNPAVTSYFGAIPYVIAKIGPVTVEAEYWWVNGEIKFENNSKYLNLYDKITIANNQQAYVDATVDMGPVYFGGMVVWVQGDNPSTSDTLEGGLVGSGKNLEPTLILFSRERYQWNGALNGLSAGLGSTGATSFANTTYQLTNGWMFQGRFGVKPTDKLDIGAKLTYAIVDKKAQSTNSVAGGLNAASGVSYVGDTYGTELDITATYKITNNLSYMLGGGYLWTGNYFQSTSASGTVTNDYLLINKLTLTF